MVLGLLEILVALVEGILSFLTGSPLQSKQNLKENPSRFVLRYSEAF